MQAEYRFSTSDLTSAFAYFQYWLQKSEDNSISHRHWSKHTLTQFSVARLAVLQLQNLTFSKYKQTHTHTIMCKNVCAISHLVLHAPVCSPSATESRSIIPLSPQLQEGLHNWKPHWLSRHFSQLAPPPAPLLQHLLPSLLCSCQLHSSHREGWCKNVKNRLPIAQAAGKRSSMGEKALAGN